jgi:phosphoribosylcarboxyaminoimidazole (NCAIR) mutase
MLANEDPALREKLRVFRQEQTAQVRQDETPG